MLESYLRCFTADKPSRWAAWLSWAEYNYNTSFHTSTEMTPFKVVYGREPPLLIPFEQGSTANHEVEQLPVQRDAILQELKDNLIRAQLKMKQSADKKRKDIEFQVGELAYVKLRPYRQLTLAKRLNEKLAPRFYGPFLVVERIGPVAYKLELPATAKIHPVFHVSLLKKAVGSLSVASDIPSTLTFDMEMLVVPFSVQGVRSVNSTDTEVLIRWKDLSPFEDTWESFDDIQAQFPAFNLEDKVALWAEGNVRPPVVVTYARKKKFLTNQQGEENR